MKKYSSRRLRIDPYFLETIPKDKIGEILSLEGDSTEIQKSIEEDIRLYGGRLLLRPENDSNYLLAISESKDGYIMRRLLQEDKGLILEPDPAHVFLSNVFESTIQLQILKDSFKTSDNELVFNEFFKEAFTFITQLTCAIEFSINNIINREVKYTYKDKIIKGRRVIDKVFILNKYCFILPQIKEDALLTEEELESIKKVVRLRHDVVHMKRKTLYGGLYKKIYKLEYLNIFNEVKVALNKIMLNKIEYIDNQEILFNVIEIQKAKTKIYEVK